MALFSKKQKELPRRRQAEIVQAARVADEELGQRYAFRRNRTLTGSSSSRVTHVGEQSADLKSPRVHAHELAAKRRRLGAILGAVLLAAGGLLVLISQFTAGVTVTATPDASLQLDASYEKEIQKYLSQQPAERLRFLLDESRLTEYLQVNSPEITSVTVGGSAGLGTSSFEVSVRRPIAGWNIGGAQRYVDATGVSFARNYFAAPSVQIVDKSGIQVESGQAVASNRFLGFVGQVVGIAKKSGYVVQQVIIPRGTTRQIELKVKGVSYPAKLSVDRPAGEQVEDMARSMQWMAQHHKKPKYIDVRVSGKAFYR